MLSKLILAIDFYIWVFPSSVDTFSNILSRWIGLHCVCVSLNVQVNGCLPDRIVVYRDGVGDGQMHVVREYEIPQMTSCFASYEDNYQPKMAVIVVQKRISTRIFQRGGQKGLTNPSPGSIMDHTITRKGWYDKIFLGLGHWTTTCVLMGPPVC